MKIRTRFFAPPLRSRPIALALSAVLVFALATTAYAASKSFSPPTNVIVVNKSIGGIAFGDKAAKAKSKWDFAKCEKENTSKVGRCTWKGTKKQGQASFGYLNGKIVSVNFEAGFSSSNPAIFVAPLTKLKTTKGIKLGSTVDATIAAYPGGYGVPVDVPNAELSYYNIDNGRVVTRFSFRNGLVSSIGLGDVNF